MYLSALIMYMSGITRILAMVVTACSTGLKASAWGGNVIDSDVTTCIGVIRGNPLMEQELDGICQRTSVNGQSQQLS
ncbi:hypothetical protein DPMN_123877 [Dreissena polymorpha]|uniref:Uncharacterized protein n=1 Tax=Dreissena polymorpha TaxID=45954 RepID=A0A9D4GR69_DREPO|nr:hypothetical protein DPMN_123877 [Dreissena polymorpha]